MNSSSKGTLLAVWSVALVVFTVTTIAIAGNKPPSAPASHPSAPASHASAPAARPSAPASRPSGGGGGGGQHPGAAGNNRGPGAGNNNNANRGGAGGNSMNRGPGGNNNNANRGAGGNSMNRGPGGGQAGNNRAGGNQTGNNRAGGNQSGNRAGGNQAGNNRAGGNQGGNKAGANQGGNRPGGNQAGKGGEKQAGNRPGAGNNNHHQPAGAKTVSLKNGGKATFRKDGKVRSIQTKNMSINHGMHGERRIVAQHNGRQVVAMGRGGRVGGYSQRAYYRNGNTTYVQRTYVYGGNTYAYGYSSYYYGGYPYYGYAPSYYYGPAYYGWAYNPWPAPVYYGWGWGGAPWYGYYGAYYQPYPVYPYASLWLADFLISASLQAAYAEQAAEGEGELVPPQFGQESSDVIASLWSSDPLIAANLASTYGSRSYFMKAAAPAATGGGTQMPADVKQAIADQMKKEVAAEKEAAANKGKNTSNSKPGEQVPDALDPNTRYFVVSTSLSVTTSDGVECALTPGDVVYRTGDTPDEDKMVDATVKSTKKDDCALGVTVGIDTSDLQEMHNNLRQNMDQGLKKLADNAGKNGLPAAPDTKTTQGEVPAPTPDSNVKDDLQTTQKEADQAEKDAQQPN